MPSDETIEFYLREMRNPYVSQPRRENAREALAQTLAERAGPKVFVDPPPIMDAHECDLPEREDQTGWDVVGLPLGTLVQCRECDAWYLVVQRTMGVRYRPVSLSRWAFWDRRLQRDIERLVNQ